MHCKQLPRRPRISVCICTCDRPDGLRSSLASLAGARELPDEVIVSDDGLGEGARAVCREFRFASYVEGPRRGLSANRNVAIAASSGDWISFLDDDATVSVDFISTAREIIADASQDTILTGPVLWNGVMHGPPGSRTFLGHFSSAPANRLDNFHIACSNLFPRHAFEHIKFDETIRFGYEEMDMADQLLVAGFRIEFRPELLNYHETPEMTDDERRSRKAKATPARFYVSVKHHSRCGRTTVIPVYAVVASLHEVAHRLKSGNGLSALGAFKDMRWALREALESDARATGESQSARSRIAKVRSRTYRSDEN